MHKEDASELGTSIHNAGMMKKKIRSENKVDLKRIDSSQKRIFFLLNYPVKLSFDSLFPGETVVHTYYVYFDVAAHVSL